MYLDAIGVVTNPFIKMLPNISGLNNELESDLAPESGRCVVCTCDKRAVSQSARRGAHALMRCPLSAHALYNWRGAVSVRALKAAPNMGSHLRTRLKCDQ